MHTIQFTSDSYNFPNNSCILHNISICNNTLDVFIIIKVYLSLIKYMFLISCITECAMFELFAQIISSFQ